MLATLLITWLSVLSLARIEAMTVDCSAEKPVISINNLPLELTHQGTIIKYEQVQIARLLNSTNVGMPKKYIAAKLDSGNLLIYTTTDFVYYARDQIATSITLELNFTCAEADRGNRTLVFKQPILLRNYYAPVFTKSLYELLLPTPIFAGFELTTLTEVAAHDNDLTQNRVTFSAVNVTQHVLSVSTKAETDALGKVYYASLRLERMYLRLEKRIEFTLCATDSGVPKRNATARIIIREDSKRHLPIMPRFEQSYYHATLERDLTMKPLRVHLTRGSYTNGLRFLLNETDSALFNISTPIISAVDVRLARTLNIKPLKNRSCLHFTIIAEHKDMDGMYELCMARTVVLVEVPKLEAYFHFLKPIYEGYIDNNGLLSMDSDITFNPLGYSAQIKFALNGSNAYAFKLRQQKNQLKLELVNHKILDDLTNQTFITLDLIAAANLLDLQTISNVLIKLPALRKSGNVPQLQPEFEKTIYRGTIFNDTGVLSLEPIVFIASTFRIFKTELSLAGDQHKNFDFILMDNSVKLQMLARPKGNLDNGTVLLLTLAAQNGKLRGHTTIALTLLKHTNATEAHNRAIFERRWLVGKILGINTTQVLYLAPIALSGVKSPASYVFILSGDEAEHFGVYIDQHAHILKLQLEKPLGNVQPTNRTELVLQIQAEHKDQPDFKSIIVIFLQLHRRDCLHQINALLPSAPKFSSDSYVFTVKPNVMGSVGHVSAMRPGHNASIHYSLTVNDPELRKRISINAQTGELMLLSYVTPGIYYFTITAQESLSLAQPSTQVRLNVETIFKCYKDEQPEVADAVIVKYIEEGRAYKQLLNVRLDEFCSLVIRDVVPSDKEYVYIDNATHMLAAKAIDRESPTFRAMAVPQLRVRLSMSCVAEPIGTSFLQMATQNLNESFVEDIPYSKDTTLVRIFIVDVNDNAPQFLQPANLSTLGYPAPQALPEIFPEYLVHVLATDADAGKNAEIHFTMHTNEHFEIDALSGIIYPKATALLYDSHVNLVVQATDAGGLSSQLKLMVQRLEDDYYTMLTIEDNERSGKLTRILETLGNNTGFDITVIRQAIMPRVSQVLESRDGNGKSNVSTQLVHEVWLYAFDNNEPITSKDLQVELAIDNLYENQSLTLQSFTEVLSERNQRDDTFGYILTIGFLALISTTCIIFLIYTFDCCGCCCKASQRLHKAYDLNPESIKEELRMDEVCGVVSPMSTLPHNMTRPSVTIPVRSICHCSSCEHVNQIANDGSTGQRETT